MESIGPHFDQIETALDQLTALRDKPSGTIRIAASDYAIDYVLWPKIRKFLPDYPDIKVELFLDNGLSDIVTERYDAGVRMGEQLAKDMISARIGPDIRFAVVGSTAYFAKHPEPKTPQELVQHRCINYRFTASGALYAWEFEQNRREVKIRVDGPLVFSSAFNVIEAALAGFGLAYVPEEIAQSHIERGRLRRVLESHCPYWDGYYLYYPSRRQASPAFVALVEALRHRE